MQTGVGKTFLAKNTLPYPPDLIHLTNSNPSLVGSSGFLTAES